MRLKHASETSGLRSYQPINAIVFAANFWFNSRTYTDFSYKSFKYFFDKQHLSGVFTRQVDHLYTNDQNNSYRPKKNWGILKIQLVLRTPNIRTSNQSQNNRA